MMAIIGTMTPASALSLGRLSVQSALGETLKADIDVTSLTPDEAANLRVKVAPPDAYRIAGVDYNPVLPSTSVTLQRRADGTPFLRITSDRPVQEPFVDVILELSWSSGRLLREYTLLFDPPSTAKVPAPTTPAAIAAAPAPARASRAEPAQAPATAAADAASRAEARRAAAASAAADAASKAAARRAAAPAPTPSPAPSSDSAQTAEGSQYTVRPGDTLSGIATKLQVSGVSLDQMLVGLYQGNSQAFAGNNMNRLRAGAVLNVPSQDKLASIDERQARRTILAQSANFNAYRQRLASAVPEQTRAPESSRKASGDVKAGVEVRTGTENQPKDALKIVPGAPAKSAAAAADEKVIKDRANQELADRRAEAERNRIELNKMLAASGVKPGASAPGAVLPAPVVSVASAPAVKASEAIAAVTAPPQVASEPLIAPPPASAPAVAASMPEAPPVAASRPPLPMDPVTAEEPSLLDSLSENPLLLPGAGLILAILAGLGYYRLRGRSKDEAGVTSFLESRMQPDSFFGASGGQRVDTRDAAASGSPSSMSYSLSQIDAIGDVDPVAEADVYLAYGRDLQAEEILKEAMRANPERLAIRTKLLEVYAKRRDTKGYEMLAGELYGLTGGQGEDWLRAQELGRSIDPENPLYEPGGQPGADLAGNLPREPLGASTMPQSVVPSPSRFGTAVGLGAAGVAGAAAAASVPDLDLDAIVDTPAPSFAAPRVAAPAVDEVDLDISLPAPMDDLPSVAGGYVSAADASFVDSRQPDAGPDSGSGMIDFELHDLPDISEPTLSAAAATSASKVDFDGLSLDFDLNPTQSPAPDSIVDEYPVLLDGTEDDGDPLARKVDLAKEFLDFGDKESARDMLQDVIEKTDSAELKARAQSMLDGLA
ncbi:FimV/HubP family polar landmark protein [Sphaerotilus sulfidivorans]|uniref:FimV/HubP family polar landmark protein n=1 Tax=Sphaerotilus sp. FB-3 TaxID=2913396 RepID=UPI00203BA702|nr:FimV/HubP family polar landmark protein [Sphaerotilus sp. FB-3]